MAMTRDEPKPTEPTREKIFSNNEDNHELFSKNEDDSLYHILRFIKLLSIIRDNNPRLLHSELDEILSKLENNHVDWKLLGTILQSDHIRAVAFYFLDYGAATLMTLQHRLGLREATAYRIAKQLRLWNLIGPALKIRKERDSRGGPRPTLHQTPGATVDQINEAQVLHRRLSSPKYRVAEEVAQLILDDYLEPGGLSEIGYREILKIIKDRGIRYRAADIGHMVAQYLSERGFRVWR